MFEIFRKRKPSTAVFNYHIDQFDCYKGRIAVAGWLFFTDFNTNSVSVRFQRGKEEYILDAVFGNVRMDLFEIFGTEQALHSGFFCEVGFENANGFDVYLQASNAEGQKEIRLGEIAAEDAGMYENDTGDTVFFIANDKGRPMSEYPLNLQSEDDLSVGAMPGMLEQPIDIIIPVYNGFEHLEALFNTVKNTKMPHRLVVIDDASSDERIWPFLQDFAKASIEAGDDILLLQNETNIGLVRTENLGFLLTRWHVCVLNTDVRLPEGWLERLMAPIILDKRISSSTPFTNCGTIMSFPIFAEDNELPEGCSLNEIDDAFQLASPVYSEIPTGIGFCMGINRYALDEVGLFDEESFGKGYGEECDWCRRTVAYGYRNVAVENLFVWHKHGGSFQSEERQRLLECNSKILSERYCDYDESVARFIRLDPLHSFRNLAVFELLKKKEGADTALVFTHDWGGGAALYIEERMESLIEAGKLVICVHTDSVRHLFVISIKYKKLESSFLMRRLRDSAKIIKGMQVDNIILNEVASYPDIPDSLLFIRELKSGKDAQMEFLLHDYLCVCPTIHIVKRDAIYCGHVTEESICRECLLDNPYNMHPKSDIHAWREAWHMFMQECEKIIIFSESSGSILKEYYPDLTNLQLKPHKPFSLPALNVLREKSGVFNIALMGKLNDIKGRKVISDLLNVSGQYGLGFILIGYTDPFLGDPRLTETGGYKRENLPQLITENLIDMVFIVSTCPETFSYIAAEAISMGIPVSSFDIGGQAEQIRKTEKGLLLPLEILYNENAETQICAMISDALNASAR